MTVAFLFPLGIAILAGLGVGSGGLFILFLTEWAGHAQHAAQGLNLAFFSLALAAALFIHLRRRPISPALLFLILSFGTLGALIGSYFSTVLAGESLRLLLGIFLFSSGAFVLFRK